MARVLRLPLTVVAMREADPTVNRIRQDIRATHRDRDDRSSAVAGHAAEDPCGARAEPVRRAPRRSSPRARSGPGDALRPPRVVPPHSAPHRGTDRRAARGFLHRAQRSRTVSRHDGTADRDPGRNLQGRVDPAGGAADRGRDRGARPRSVPSAGITSIATGTPRTMTIEDWNELSGSRLARGVRPHARRARRPRTPGRRRDDGMRPRGALSGSRYRTGVPGLGRVSRPPSGRHAFAGRRGRLRDPDRHGCARGRAPQPMAAAVGRSDAGRAQPRASRCSLRCGRALLSPPSVPAFSLPLFAMADPWLLGFLVIAAAVSSIPLARRPERLRSEPWLLRSSLWSSS